MSNPRGINQYTKRGGSGVTRAYHGGPVSKGGVVQPATGKVYAALKPMGIANAYAKRAKGGRIAIVNVIHRRTGTELKSAGGWPGQVQHSRAFGEKILEVNRPTKVIGYVPRLGSSAFNAKRK